MKTARILLIAVLLVFTAVSITNADGFKEKPKYKILNVTLVQALGVPGLPAAMSQQLDKEELIGCGCSSFYVANVLLQNVMYRITGSQQEWTVFFNWADFIIGDDNNIIISDH